MTDQKRLQQHNGWGAAQRFLPIVALVLLVWGSISPLRASSPLPHDFHVTVTRIDYNAANRSLEVAIKIFSDDIEQSLEVIGGPRLHLGSEREYAQTDSLLEVYLHNRLSLSVNGQDRDFEFVGKEVEMDVTWCYIEFTGVEPVETLTLRNQILFELFDDQSNLVHLFIGEKEASMLLHKGFREDTAQF